MKRSLITLMLMLLVTLIVTGSPPTLPPTGSPSTLPPTDSPPPLPPTEPTDSPPTLPPTDSPPTLPPTDSPPTLPSSGPNLSNPTGQSFSFESFGDDYEIHFLSEDRLVLATNESFSVLDYESGANRFFAGWDDYYYDFSLNEDSTLSYTEYYDDGSSAQAVPLTSDSSQYSSIAFPGVGLLAHVMNAQVYDSFNENSLVKLPVSDVSSQLGANFSVLPASLDVSTEVKDGALRISQSSHTSSQSETTEHVNAASIYELGNRFFIETLVQFSNVDTSSHISGGLLIVPSDSDEFGINFLVECIDGRLYLKVAQDDYANLGSANITKTILLDGLSLEQSVRLLVTNDPQVSTLYFEYMITGSAQGAYKRALDYNYSTGGWQLYNFGGSPAESLQGSAIPDVADWTLSLNAVEVILKGWFNNASVANWQDSQINFLEYSAAVEYFPGAFDPAAYLALNPDVEAAFGRDLNAAWLHYVNYGVYEGRTHSASFQIDDYLALNPDVAAAFGSDKGAALEHWFNYGKAEGRLGYQSWPSSFVPSEYLAFNGDVAAAFGADYNAVWSQYVNYGVYEGRRHSETFQIDDYLNLNPDLAAVFGSDKGAALEHWFNYGKAEGRLGYQSWPSTFVPSEYLERHEDLAAAFGADYNAAWSHYLNYGVDEGRSHSDRFSIDDYLALNQDVADAFGSDKVAALQHWFNYGKAEGRMGYQGWPSTFVPSEYLARNGDVAAAFGADFNAAWSHYLNYGVDEGRTHSDSFSIDDYLTLNPDVAAAFGSDKGAALEHWFNYGINEGRTAFIP